MSMNIIGVNRGYSTTPQYSDYSKLRGDGVQFNSHNTTADTFEFDGNTLGNAVICADINDTVNLKGNWTQIGADGNAVTDANKNIDIKDNVSGFYGKVYKNDQGKMIMIAAEGKDNVVVNGQNPVVPEMVNEDVSFGQTGGNYKTLLVDHAAKYKNANGGYTINDLSKLYGFKLKAGQDKILDLDGKDGISVEEAAVGLAYLDTIYLAGTGTQNSYDGKISKLDRTHLQQTFDAANRDFLVNNLQNGDLKRVKTQLGL